MHNNLNNTVWKTKINKNTHAFSFLSPLEKSLLRSQLRDTIKRRNWSDLNWPLDVTIQAQLRTESLTGKLEF